MEKAGRQENLVQQEDGREGGGRVVLEAGAVVAQVKEIVCIGITTGE